MTQNDGDLLLEEFHDAGIYLWEERRDMGAERERVEASVGSNKLAFEMQRAFGVHALHSQQNMYNRGAQGSNASPLIALGVGSALAGGVLGCSVVHAAHRHNPGIMRMFGLLP